MRRLLRRRPSADGGRRVKAPFAVVALSLASAVLIAAVDDAIPPAVRITSPLGRSGIADTMRIVARVTAWTAPLPPTVRFFVDGALLSTDADGPPYVAEWTDENPFDRKQLRVEVGLPDGTAIGDEITLEPLEFIESAQVISVGLEATVQDQRGKYVGNLTAADFHLREDGVTQSLDFVSIEAVATTFALLIDTSQSMSRSMTIVRDAAERLAEHLRGDDTVLVAPFKAQIVSVTGPTRDRTTIGEAVGAIRPSGKTAILDALTTAAERFVGGDRRVIVLVTDGYDEGSVVSVDRAIESLKRAQATVHVIAIGGVAGVSLNGETLIRRLTAETGGRAFFPWNGAQLAAAHAAITEDARSRYRMAYTPINQRHDGTWRVLELQVREPGFVVRTRKGFTAPSPAPVRASIEFTGLDTAQQHLDVSRDDLQVIEDGVPQDVDSFHEAVAPVSIMLALDASGSMTKAVSQVQEAVRAFVGTLRPADALAMLGFSDKPQLMHGFTVDRDESARAITRYAARGGTALYDALSDGLAELAGREGRRVLVVVSDGRDENAKSNGPGSRRSWAEVIARARELDVTVYPIGLGSRVDAARLNELAALTGGEAYVAATVSELETQYRRVLEELRRRYVVTYTSTNGARDGKWRKVEIRVHRPGVRVRSRGGYFAPEPD